MIAHFKLKTPAYLEPKPTPADEAKKAAQSQALAEAHARDKHRAVVTH